MKKLLVFLLTAPLAAQTINPNQIRPSDHTGWVLTTPLASTPPVWAPLPSTATPAFNMVTNPPIAGQYAIVYPTGGVITRDPPGQSDIFANGVISGGDFTWTCNGILCSIAGDVEAHWTGFALPSYINPANVTAIYADAITSSGYANGGWTDSYSGTTLLCNGAQTMLSQTSFPYASTEVSTLTGLTGATFNSTAECHIQVGGSGPGNHGQQVKVSAIRFLVYYTGTPPPVDTALHLAPPLGLNVATNTLFVNQNNWPADYLRTWFIRSLPPAATTGTFMYTVVDGTSATDCTTGGGTTEVLCYSNGSIYVPYSGGGGAVSSVSNSNGTLTVTPTTGAVVASLALGHANTWTAKQTQPAPLLSDLAGGGTQCLNVDNTGQVSGTGSACGSGGGGVTGSGTTNFIPKWTGSTALGNSHIDDGVTTASTLTASEPIAVNDGTGAAGAIKLQQGTAATNGTNAVTLTVPSSVTSYRVQLPGVEPTSGNTYLSCTAADPAVCSWAAGGSGGSLPTATAAGQIIASTGAGITYAAQPLNFYAQASDTISSIETECSSPCIYHVNIAQTFTLSASHALSSNVTVDFGPSGVWKLNGATFWLYFTNPITATLNKHFDLTGTANGVNFQSNSTSSNTGTTQNAWVRWWGAVPDGSTDATAAIQACANATPKNCMLENGTYIISSPLLFTWANTGGNVSTGLIGNGSSCGTGNYACTLIQTTSASNDMIDIAGQDATHPYNGAQFSDFILNRTVIGSGTAKGLSCVHCWNVQILRVTSNNSIYDFYAQDFWNVDYGMFSDNTAQWGTGTTQTVYGFVVDTAGLIKSGSLYIERAQVSTSSISTLTSTGFYLTGNLNSDFFCNRCSASKVTYDAQVNDTGGGGFHNTDIHFFNSIFDSPYTACAKVSNAVVGDTAAIQFIGGWCALTGTYGFDIESSTGVQISNMQFAQVSANTSPAIHAASSANLVINGNTFIQSGGTTQGKAVEFVTTTDSTVSANTMHNAGSNTPTLIDLSSTSVRNAIGNNALDGVGIGIAFDATSTSNTALNNACGASLTNCVTDTAGTNTYNNNTTMVVHGATVSTSNAFSALTSSTNTTAAMVVGSGASLAPTGTGTIQATNIASTIAAGANVTITGSGTTASPYSIAAASSGSGALIQLAQQVVAGTSTSTVTFSSISGSYSQLYLVIYGAISDSGGTFLTAQFNGDTGSNYSRQDGGQNNAGTWSGGTASTGQTSTYMSVLPGTGSATHQAGEIHVWIDGYTSTAFDKIILSQGIYPSSTSTKGQMFTDFTSGTWYNATPAAITSIAITDSGGGHFVAGTTFTLYGVQ